MHEAYILHNPTGVEFIESITGFDNTLLLGTRPGHLLMYSVNQVPNERKVALTLQQYDRNFSKKPVVQIDVIPEYKLLFSLSDSLVNVYDISRLNFPLVHTALRTKGASLFALNVKRSKSLTGETALVVRLCVSVKRKLQLWYWKHDTLLEFAADIELNDTPKTVQWFENTICVGFKTEYILYDLSGKFPVKKDLFPTSSSRTIDPCIAIVDDVFAVAKDEFLIAVDPRTSFQDLHSTALAGSVSKEGLKEKAEQKKMFKSLAWQHPIQTLIWDKPYAIGLLQSGLEIRTLDCFGLKKDDTLVQSIPDVAKARHLIKIDDGLLFAASVSHLWCIQAVDVQKQRPILLQQKNFHLALQLTNISTESDAEKQEKIHQIQTLFAFDLFDNKHFQESMKEFTKLKTDPCDVIRLFPNLLPTNSNGSKTTDASNSPTNTGNNTKFDDRELEMGLLALIDYLTEVRYNLRMDIKGSKEVERKLTPLLSIIDTTLLKCYLQTNDSLVAPLLRFNFCHLEESEKTLLQYQKYGELIILYQTKGQHKKALQLLQTQSEIHGSNLFGHEKIVQYLQQLGSDNKHLIFEFSNFILKKHPEDGLRIFIEDIPEVEALPRAEILDYLLKSHKSLVVPYLEHIIYVWNESKPIFHNILIQQYKERIKDSKYDTNAASKEKCEEMGGKLFNFLKTSTKYSPETILNDFPIHDLFEERAIILGRLKKHEKVLIIYIQILGDFQKAVEYCDEVHKASLAANDIDYSVFVHLIRILLTIPTTAPYSGVDLHPFCLQSNLNLVLELLEKHATKIDTCEVLQILPSEIPLWRLSKLMENSLSNQLEVKRKSQVLRGLLYAEKLQIQEQLKHYESKSVLINDYTICPVCKKKFANQSAFVRYPNGDVVHFSCRDRVM